MEGANCDRAKSSCMGKVFFLMEGGVTGMENPPPKSAKADIWKHSAEWWCV